MMRSMWLAGGVWVLAFAVGLSGLPGAAVSTGAGWLMDSGHVTVVGPVADVVRESL